MSEQQTTYTMIWRAKGLADGAKDITEIIEQLEYELADLKKMKGLGVKLVSPVEDDYAILETTNERVAAEFDYLEVKDEEEI